MKEFSDKENGEHGKDELFLFKHSRNFKGLQPSMFYVCVRDRSLFIAQGGRRIIWFWRNKTYPICFSPSLIGSQFSIISPPPLYSVSDDWPPSCHLKNRVTRRKSSGAPLPEDG